MTGAGQVAARGEIVTNRSRLYINGIGDVLMDARRCAGLTQAEVGRRVGRPQNWVSDIERGQAYCRFEDFIAIANAVGAAPLALCARYLELRAARKAASSSGLPLQATQPPCVVYDLKFAPPRRADGDLSEALHVLAREIAGIRH